MVREGTGNEQFNDFSLEDLTEPRGVIPTNKPKGKKGGRASREDDYYGKKWHDQARKNQPDDQ